MTKDNSREINVPILHFSLDLLARLYLYAHTSQGLTISQEIAIHFCGKVSVITKSLDDNNELSMNIHLNFKHYLCLLVLSTTALWILFSFMLFLLHFLLSLFWRFNHSLESRFTNKKKSTLVPFFYTRIIFKKILKHLAYATKFNQDLQYQS